jgi:hypothetical protein
MKRLSTLLILFAVLTLGFSLPSFAADLNYQGLQGTVIMSLQHDFLTFANGKATAAAQPVVRNGTTYVPLRFVAEAFGAKVDYDPKTLGISVQLGNDKLQFRLKSKTYYRNQEKKSLQTAVFEINGRSYLPLRIMAENLNKSVYYAENTGDEIFAKMIYIAAAGADNPAKKLADNPQLAEALRDYANEVLYGKIIIEEGNLLIKQKGTDLYISNNDSPHFYELSYDLESSYIQWLFDGQERYLKVFVSDFGARGHYSFLHFSQDKKITYLFSAESETHIHDVKINGGYIYYLHGFPWEPGFNPLALEDDLYLREKYEGNLFRVNIEDAKKQGDNVQKQRLGQKGYYYGVKSQVGPWRDGAGKTHPENVVWLGDWQEEQYSSEPPVLDWEIRENGVYALGVDLSATNNADKTVAHYLIDFSNNSHKRLD